MITLHKEETLKNEILHVLNEAKKKKHPIIFSYVTKVAQTDPLQIFSIFASLHKGKRFFWSTPEQNFILCGVGTEMTLTNDQDSVHRFYTIEAIWNEWKHYTHVFGQKDYGSGPMLFGGFSFDPKKENKSSKWSEFSSARFHLPCLMVTKHDEEMYLTINKIVHREDKLEELFQHFESYQNMFKRNYIPYKEKNPSQQDKKIYYQEKWLQTVQKATELIKANRFEKVVLAREVLLSFDQPIPIHLVLNKLKKTLSTSYLFAFEVGKKCFVGATPERLVKKKGKQVFSTCLAGSIKRGKNKIEDDLLGEQLLRDPKNLLEHEIVVRMIKNAFEKCCDEVETKDSPTLLKTQNIQHLYTPIKGKIKNGFSLMDVVEKLHPTPALGGYPKKEALQFIRDEEPMERGWYAAPIGWIDLEDNGEFVVAIRSTLIDHRQAYLFAGCGIVQDSIPEEEWKETEIKLGPMLYALGGTKDE